MVRFITEFSSSLSGRSERPQVENEQGSVVKSITGNDSLLVPSFFLVSAFHGGPHDTKEEMKTIELKCHFYQLEGLKEYEITLNYRKTVYKIVPLIPS